jgi:hypothetical protein
MRPHSLFRQDYRGQCPKVTQVLGMRCQVLGKAPRPDTWYLRPAFLLRRHQRMRDGVHRQRNPILHTHLAHQFRHVRFYRALLDA